ncbi:hypothetical protein AZI85_02255 [Bdellovibrio bacteriovorus]|uniref:Uncharacterized protein n=1 Tax=Bdellovibrio bacteriovorus TaxID=959 RepID=A0A150WWE4_BDEBC|nr:hypothetical protein [Bdellovibrio bacteriovorus]KYG70773.1 hypothetical protein AZI85_02255 [Bdellovibrio bacteriovorus]
MLKVSVCSLGALLFLSFVQAHAAPLNLGSDAATIKSKSKSIEAEYARDIRMQHQSNAFEERPQQGALVIEQGNVEEEEAPVATAPTMHSVPQRSTSSDVIHSIPGAANTYYSGSNGYSYDTTLKMRAERKVGAGVAIGGTLGVAGFNMELNFEEADGVVAGFGTGPGYNTFQVAWKHAFDGDFLAPYTTVGYSRWYNSRGRSSDYENSDILDRVLTESEKKTGRFGTDFVNASAGLQYNQLNGEFAGLSFFGELTGMWEVKRSMILPNGSVGAIYYF